MRSHHLTHVLAAFISVCSSANAQTADLQTAAFLRIFRGTCMQHLANLDTLREKLKAAPSLPPEKAAYFLAPLKMAGTAWPVPDPSGTFVLAIPTDKNLCAVFSRRLLASEASDTFIKMLQSPPEPLHYKLITDEVTSDPKNGTVHRLGIQWSVEGASRKLSFILTTATGETAELQGLATASIGQD
jgi:hypothetical protein